MSVRYTKFVMIFGHQSNLNRGRRNGPSNFGLPRRQYDLPMELWAANPRLSHSPETGMWGITPVVRQIRRKRFVPGTKI